jgi:hypothetical protein
MAAQSKGNSYQSLGNGVFRVGGAVQRSAVTGRYITESSRSAPSSISSYRVGEKSGKIQKSGDSSKNK